ARGWELAIAGRLARLLHEQGRDEEARDLLQPVYACFTEGLETADVRNARALLGELRPAAAGAAGHGRPRCAGVSALPDICSMIVRIASVYADEISAIRKRSVRGWGETRGSQHDRVYVGRMRSSGTSTRLTPLKLNRSSMR